MNFDILVDFLVEKIRNDFGDLSATLFQILTFRKNSNLYEINKIIPFVKYNVLKFSFFKFFNHDVIFFKKNIKNFNTLYYETAKIYPSLYTVIMRIRFPRFLSIVEKEYGKTSKKMIKNMFDQGCVNPTSSIMKLNLSAKNFLFRYTEAHAIILARDQLIKKIFFPKFSTRKKILEKNEIKIFSQFNKPVFYEKFNYLWKISYLKLSSILKIDLAICMLEEYCCYVMKIIFRSCLGKVIGNNFEKIFLSFFSLDSLKDYTEEISGEFFDEMLIICVVEKFLSGRSSVQIKNNTFKFKIKTIFNILKKKITENLINNRFGKDFLVFFDTIYSCLIFNENYFSENPDKKKYLKKFFYHMYRLNFISLEEKSKYDFTFSFDLFVLWKLNLNILFDKFLFEIYKTIYNLLLKIGELNNLLKKIRRKSEQGREIVSGCDCFFSIDILKISIFRLDGLIMILEI